MSFDGDQRIAIVRSNDEESLSWRTRKLLSQKKIRTTTRSVVLAYAFGFGPTRAIEFKHLDAVVKLPWQRMASSGNKTEMRQLSVAKIAEAQKALDELRSRPRRLSRKIAAATEDDDSHDAVYAVLKSDPRDLDVGDVEPSAARLAQFFMQLRRCVRRASAKGDAVGVGIRVERA